jgi:hypothetical protein
MGAGLIQRPPPHRTMCTTANTGVAVDLVIWNEDLEAGEVGLAGLYVNEF